jgi:hypothetical protein
MLSLTLPQRFFCAVGRNKDPNDPKEYSQVLAVAATGSQRAKWMSRLS